MSRRTRTSLRRSWFLLGWVLIHSIGAGHGLAATLPGRDTLGRLAGEWLPGAAGGLGPVMTGALGRAAHGSLYNIPDSMVRKMLDMTRGSAFSRAALSTMAPYFFAGSVIGTGASALTQLVTSGNVDWLRAIGSGVVSTALPAVLTMAAASLGLGPVGPLVFLAASIGGGILGDKLGSLLSDAFAQAWDRLTSRVFNGGRGAASGDHPGGVRLLSQVSGGARETW